MKLLKHIISIPFIWLPILTVIPMHIAVWLYQSICFRLYGIKLVKLGDYVSFDREKLRYLSTIDKINCAYCSYANGIFGYVAEIGHRTEYYWCGIKHKNQPDNPAFAYQSKFAAYGNKEDFQQVKFFSGRDNEE